MTSKTLKDLIASMSSIISMTMSWMTSMNANVCNVITFFYFEFKLLIAENGWSSHDFRLNVDLRISIRVELLNWNINFKRFFYNNCL